jgi:hypothetical protein
MRRVILLALLVLALPTAVLANSINFAMSGGKTTVTSNSVTIGSYISTIGMCNPTCPSNPIATSGTVLITLPNFATNTTASYGSGGSLYLSAGGYVFNGTFTAGTLTVFTNSKGKPIGYAFGGSATGTLTLHGQNIQTTLTFLSGNTAPGCSTKNAITKCAFAGGYATVGVAPEPGTLGLLGTGLIGLAGIVRHKFRA